MKEEVLNKVYITAQDIKQLIPTMSIANCLELIKEIRQDMKEKNLYVPQTKPLLASTEILKKKLGIK